MVLLCHSVGESIEHWSAVQALFHDYEIGSLVFNDSGYGKSLGQVYRAVDGDGNTFDFLLCARRDKHAAQRYFEQSMVHNGVPETVAIDQGGANLAAQKAINAERESPIRIRQRKHLNNIVEQDHRSIKSRIQLMLGFKKFNCARILLAGIELMHMIHHGQMKHYKLGRTTIQIFHSLAA